MAIRKRSSGVALFTAASALRALSQSLPWLVAARFAQGIGGVAVMALGIGLIPFTYPHRLLGSVIGWRATVIALSAAHPSCAADSFSGQIATVVI